MTETHREILERALDVLAQHLRECRPLSVGETQLYERAVSLVREIPQGARRYRIDRHTTRGPQIKLDVDQTGDTK